MATSALVATALRLVREYMRASDLAVAAALLFACSALANRALASSRGTPMLWPVLGMIPTLFAKLDDVYEWGAASLARSPGGTFPFRGMWLGGMSGVVTSSPRNVEHVLGTRFANYPKGPYYRDRFAELLGDGIFNADGDAWRAQRRAAALEMHSARFLAFSDGAVRRLVHGRLVPLLTRVGDDTVVDLQDVLLRFTFDNICAAAFGVDVGCLADGLPEVPFARAFERATELTLARFVVPPFVWKAQRWLGVGGERELASAARAVREFADRTVAERRAELRKLGSLDDRSDLLSRLIIAEGKYSDAFLRDFCVSFILAGRDTSSVALTWFFYLLASHPHVESRVLADIRAAPRGDVAEMDYLHAALTESMRLYPPVPVDFKEALADDVLPDGSAIRAGERVIYFTYAMGRDANTWGPDRLEFRPERWMRGGRFAGGGESPFKYVVFNAGPRLCVGKRFAYAQMKTAAAAVLARFRVEVVPGQEVKPKLNTTLYMKHGLMVRFTARDQPQVAEGKVDGS
ncbi:hypothetical protein QOZ80_7BG0601190 [Eleusine coracana subsp. coracana]|nr:hypothetical protein QOZ80_7BG0601190 [Eleusine coracana subsp. coracana]